MRSLSAHRIWKRGIRMLKLRQGGHRDLEKYYGLMEIDYDSEELIPKLALHRALISRKAELLICHDDETGIETGYALCFVNGVYGYVLLKNFAVVPWLRGKGLGAQMMRLEHKRFAQAQGIVTEITEFEDEDPDHMRKQQKFLKRFGYEEIKSDYRISGVKAHLYFKGIKNSSDMSCVAHRVIQDIYSGILSSSAMLRMIDINKVESAGR